jgi:hypothetical protein
MSSNSHLSVVPKKFFQFRVNEESVQKLYFLALIDYWMTVTNEAAVLDALPSCMENAEAKAWFERIVATKPPKQLTLARVRAALLADLESVGIKITDRYRMKLDENQNPICPYFQSSEFKLMCSFIEEIEELKQRVSKQDQWIGATQEALKMKGAEMVNVDWDGMMNKVSELKHKLMGNCEQLTMKGDEGAQVASPVNES